MNASPHIPKAKCRPLLIWLCVGICVFAMAVMGCGLQGFECRADGDCGTRQTCTDGWCQTSPLTPSQQCAPGKTRKCPDRPGIFGICEFGTQTCQKDGRWSACEGVVIAQAETCNRVDDDCNGQIDDGIDCGCQSGSKRACQVQYPIQGRCHPGTQFCDADGQWSKCQQQIKPSAEICNGLDDDCDGQTDEDNAGSPLRRSCYDGMPKTRGKGSCKAGTQICENGAWQPCQGQQLPSPELCNGIDDNCDGNIDEPCTACAYNHFANYIGEPYDHIVDKIVWSPAGDQLIAMANSGTFQLWQYPQNVHQGSVILSGPLATHTAPAVSRDGRYLAIAMQDNSIELYRLPHGRYVATLRGHSRPPSALAFHPTQPLLLSMAGEVHELRIWSTNSGTLSQAISTDASQSWEQLTVTPDGKRFATISSQHSLVGIWEFGTSRPAQLYEGCRLGHKALQFTDNETLLTVCQGNEQTNAKAERWSLSTHKRKDSKTLSVGVIHRISLRYLQQEKKSVALVVTQSQKGPILVSLHSGQTLQQFSLGQSQPGIQELRIGQLSPNGEFIAGSNGAPKIWLWRVGSRQPAGTLAKEVKRHRSTIFSMAYDSQRHRLATSSLSDEAIRIWNVDPRSATYATQIVTLQSASGAGGQLAFSRDGRWLASTDIYNQIVLWNTQSNTVHATLSKHGNTISKLSFSRDGKRLVSFSQKGKTAILWSIPSGEFVRYLSINPIQNIALHPDGNHLAIGLTQHIEIRTLSEPVQTIAKLRTTTANALQWLLFRPDGRELLFASDGISRWMWNNPTSTPLGTWQPEMLQAMHPSSRLMALGQDDGHSIAFVQLKDGNQIGRLVQVTDAPKFTGVIFGSVPQLMFTSQDNGLLKAWDCKGIATP